MKTYVRPYLHSMICAAIGLGVAGCEDPAANRREDAQTKINALRQELQLAVAGSAPSAGDEAVSKLDGIVQRLASINNAEPGQEAAKAVLSATALRELANIQIAEIGRIEAEHRAQRASLHSMFDSALRLDAIASGAQQVDTSAAKQELQAAAQAARLQAEELNTQMGELSGPIAEHTSYNQEHAQKVEQLRLEVSQLLRRFQELGYSQGLETFKRAKATSRQADRIEYDIAHREIDLDFQLTPEHEMAGQMKSQLEAMIASIDAAEAEIAKGAQVVSSDIAATRARVSSLATQIMAGVNKLGQERRGAEDSAAGLENAYAEAQSLLEKAIGQAQTATRSKGGADDAQAAKMLLARLHEAQGQLHLSKARGLEDHKSLLERLAQQARVLGNPPKLAEEVKSTGEAAVEARDQAKNAYTEAQQAAEQVQDRNNEMAIDRFKQGLEGAVASLEGRSAAAASPGAASATGVTGTGGAESPEALAEAMKSAQGASDPAALFDLMIPLDDVPGVPAGVKAFASATKSMLSDVSNLDRALKERFGQGLEATEFGQGMAAGMASGFPKVANATVQNVKGDRGSLAVTTSDGKRQTIQISQVNGRWYVGTVQDFTGGLGGGMGAPGGGAGAPQMPDAMMQGMATTFETMGRAMSEFAKAVERGEFATFEDAKKQFEERMQKATMQSGGGMGGMGLGF